jgi:hypothetical protein
MRIAEGTYNHYEDLVEIGKEDLGRFPEQPRV